ncbi:hypothetical protein CHUAL_003073 [Chamberlinius hualienensis]
MEGEGFIAENCSCDKTIPSGCCSNWVDGAICRQWNRICRRSKWIALSTALALLLSLGLTVEFAWFNLLYLSVAAYRAITDTTAKRLTREWQRGSHVYGSINGGSPSHSLSIEDQADKQPEIKSAFDGHSDQTHASSGSSSTKRKSSSVSPSLPQTQTTCQPCSKTPDEPAVKAIPSTKANKQEVKKFMSNQRSLGNQRWMKLRTTVQLTVRQAFPELQSTPSTVLWHLADGVCDLVFILDIGVQFRTGYLEQGLMVYDSRKLAKHYVHSKAFALDLFSLFPLDLLRLLVVRPSPLFRFPRFLKVYRSYYYYYMVESRTLYPNLWRVVNLVHILLLLAHWFGCFYYLLSEAEGFVGEWVYPNPVEDFSHLTRKYLASVYWSTLTLTTIGDLPTPESDCQ